jgi:hypothetical protein
MTTWDAAQRHPNHIFQTGDSRQANGFTDVTTQYQFSCMHWFNQANARMGQRMKVVGNNAVSGQRSDQYLSQANINQAIASDAKFVMIFGIVNDITLSASSDPFINYVKPACEQFIAAGMTVILVTDPGSTGLNGSTAARAAFQRYNSLVKAYAARSRANGQVVCFDLAALILDLTTTTIAFKSGYSTDGTHYLVNAAVPVGRAFAALMTPLVPALPIRKVFGGETPALGLQIFSNPGFLTLSGGTIGGFTGTAPAGMTNGSVDAGVSCALTSATNADGTKDIILTMSSTGAGRCRMIMDISAGNDSPGDIFDVSAQCTIASGATNLVSAELWSEYNQSTNSPNSVDYSCLTAATTTFGTAGPGDIAETLDLTMPVVIQPGTRGFWTVRFNHYFSGAGNATVNWRHLAVDKRQS